MYPNNPAFRLLIPAAICALAFTGCDRAVRPIGSTAEADDPVYKEAKQLEESGQEAKALALYAKVIRSRETASESHQDCARILGGSTTPDVRDPIAAIYHLREYVRQTPGLDAKRLDLVKQQIRAQQKAFLNDPALPFHIGGEVADTRVDDLRNKLRDLRAENDTLKQQLTGALVAARAPAPVPVALTNTPVLAAPSVSAPPRPTSASSAAPVGGRTYSVVSGDTLTRIAQKVYGKKSRWPDILNANLDQVPTANSRLPIGMSLKIPD